MMTQMPQDPIQVGQLKAPYGLQGWLWVYANTNPIANIFDYQPWFIQTATGWQTLHVKRWRAQGKGLVVRIDEVPDRTAAESMVGTALFIPKGQLPKPQENEYYWSDLIGLQVFGLPLDNGEKPLLGVIDELFETGANDVMVVKPCVGSVDKEERLIPWHTSIIETVDMSQKQIFVNWAADY